MARKWAIWLSVEGDLRFLSHHDTMRLLERAATRAKLPLRYTQGFNPHPMYSLVCPRPVGVASQDDLLILTMDDFGPPDVDGRELLSRLNRQAPHGMRFLRARPLEGKRTPRARAASYSLPLRKETVRQVRRRLDELRGQDAWPVQRRTPPKHLRSAPPARTIDVKLLVGELDLTGERLRVTLRAQGDLWARPGELLRLLGLDERLDLAAAVRTGIEYEF